MVKIFPIGKTLTKSTLNKANPRKFSNVFRNNVALPTVTALAFLAGIGNFTSCTKALDLNTPRNLHENSKVVNNFDSILSTLGIMPSESTVRVIDNICFEDSEGYQYFLENIKTNNEEISFKYSKLKDDFLQETKDMTLIAEDNFLNLGITTKSGKQTNKKYSVADNKVIEYKNIEGIYIPQSNFIRTEEGFRQENNNGSHKDYLGIKLNTNLPAIRISIDTTCNIVEHHITL